MQKVPKDILAGGNKPWNVKIKDLYRLRPGPCAPILLSISKLSAWSLTYAVKRV